MAAYRCPQEWADWAEWLAVGLHGRCRWRLAVLLTGILFAVGRRTVASWLRAAGVTDDWKAYYYFISSIGRKSDYTAHRLLRLLLKSLPTGPALLFALDDSPTARYGPKVEGAGIHHNPTPGPADSRYVYGHIWVTLALIVRHRLWGTIGLPLLARLYIRLKDIGKLPRWYHWAFTTKLQQAVELIRWAAQEASLAGKPVWIVADGFYAKRPVFKEVRARGAVLIGRLRKDAALWTLPPRLKEGQPRGQGRPRKYGTERISLAKRAGSPRGWNGVECVQYGQRVRKKIKTFLATYPPAYGTLRVVIVQEPGGPQFFFSTDPAMSAEQILEVFADRAAIEQDFHDVKEVEGAGQQQVRHLWANIGAWHLNLWVHTLVELWAWNKPQPQICDRSASPWDDPDRRPSHADRRKALRRWMLREEYSAGTRSRPLPRKLRAVLQRLLKLVA